MSRDEPRVEPLERAGRAQQQQRGLAAPVLGVGELGVQQLHARPAQLVELVDLRGREQLDRGVEPPGLQARLRGRQRPVDAPLGIAREGDGPPEERRRGGQPAARLRPAGGALQLGGHGLVGAGRRRGQVPCATVSAGARVGHLGQREVHGPPFARRRRAVDRRADERMQEGHALPDHQEPLGLVRRRLADPEPLDRAPDQQRVVDRLRGGDEQQQPRIVGQRLQASQEALLDPPRHLGGGLQAERRRQLRGGQGPRQLEDGQRVPPGLGHETADDALVDAARDDGGEQRACVLVGQRPEVELRQPRELAGVGRVADGEHERHRLGEQPAGDEAEHLRGGRVEPLRVVDDAQQRALGSGLGEEAQRRERDQEAVGRGAGRQPQGDAEGRLLRGRQGVEPAEQRRAQLMEAGERQLHLRLDAGHPRDAEARRLPGAVVQQRGLAHPGLAPHDQHRAAVIASVLEQPIERPALGGTAQENRVAVRGHLSRNPKGPGTPARVFPGANARPRRDRAVDNEPRRYR